ncbi:hypothetical protein HanXRQr2_Chr11g0520181 [Helianthus annuus]|uniref:Uncharacterized protein n=1 Tax=Helianthus annuus TaxID=4232 RepID=A0A9K3HTN8_HELAN|nr:hypothetical protein HanXRQr2_Chr11g0520181 [Helianthus annuus]
MRLCCFQIFGSYILVTQIALQTKTMLIHVCGRDSTRFDLARFDSVRFGSSPTSRHSSVVRPRVRHAKHGEPRMFPA